MQSAIQQPRGSTLDDPQYSTEYFLYALDDPKHVEGSRGRNGKEIKSLHQAVTNHRGLTVT